MSQRVIFINHLGMYKHIMFIHRPTDIRMHSTVSKTTCFDENKCAKVSLEHLEAQK